jgi:hypothetical protein
MSVMSGANAGQAALNAGISFAIGVIGGIAGAGIGGTAGVSKVGSFFANTMISAGLSAGATAIKAAASSNGDLSNADFEDTMRDWAIGTLIGTAASAVSAGVEGLGGSGEGENGKGGSDNTIMGNHSQSTTSEKPVPYKNISGKDLPSGPVTIHIGPKTEMEFASMKEAFNWLEQKSIIGGGKWVETQGGEKIWINQRREVDVTFYRPTNVDPSDPQRIHGDVKFGSPYECTVDNSPKNLIDSGKVDFIGVAHTHPWGAGEYAIDPDANQIVGMGYGPSTTDAQTDRNIDNYIHRNSRAWVIQNHNIMEY